jgi:HlyD family secretion protein
MTAQTRRKVFVITVGAIVIIALVYGFIPKPLPVDIALVSRGPLRVTIEEESRTRVRDRFVISAPVQGFLRRIELDVGDRVERGRQVAVLDPTRSTVLDPRSRAEAEAAVSAAQAALETAKERAVAAAADAKYSHQRLNRAQELFSGGFVSRDDFEQADAAAKRADAVRDSANAAVNSAKADLDRAESVLRYSGARPRGSAASVVVRSPVAGSVLKLHRQSEGVVSGGEPLLDVGDPGNLEIKSEVLSTQALKINSGMRVLFERWGGRQELEGRVRIVEPAGFTKVSSLGVEEQRVLIIMDFTSPPEVWQALGDGYRLDVVFLIWEGSSVLQVPESALFRKGEDWAVFTIENNRAKMRDVDIGRRNGIAAEILEGLSEGTAVITHPDDTIREGVKVKLRPGTR